MGYVVRMPEMGMEMEAGTVVEWLVDEGAAVTEGMPIAVVESEKASMDLEAREDSVLRAVVVPEGERVEPGAALAVVADPDERLESYRAEMGADVEIEDAADSADGGATGPDGEQAGTAQTAGGAAGDDGGSGEIRATPGARRRAEREGVDLTRVEATGPFGAIVEDDVAAHLDATAGAATATEPGAATRTVRERREPSRVQQRVGEQLRRSVDEAVHVTLNRSVEAEALREVLAAAESAGADASLTDLLVKAAAETLTDHPEFNALFEDGTLELIEEVNVGVAVDVRDGLLTPVVPSVDRAPVEAVHEARVAVTERALDGEYTADDLSGGTFTVTNLGPHGVDHFDPVINSPEVAILGVGRVTDGAMTLSLSLDHRVVNGADGARFLDDLAGRLTDAATLASYFERELATGGLGPRTVRAENEAGLAGRYRTASGDVAFDEPEEVGGSGSAPSPVDHLLGALASCLSLSVREMAERDGVDLGRVEADVEGSPEHGPLEAVDVLLTVETDAPTDAVETAVTKAERACYVARSLSEDLDVSVEWTAR